VSDVTISPVSGGAGIRFGLAGDATLSNTGGAAWTTVDRPRQKGFAEYTAVQLSQMAMPLMIDHDDCTDVEAECTLLDSWRLPLSVGGVPPRFRLEGPLPPALGVDAWVLLTIAWGAAIRRNDGRRTQQAITLTMLESGQASTLTDLLSGAQRAVAATTVQSTAGPEPVGRGDTYTVRAGDTLYGIAFLLYGDPLRWVDIAARNGVRDPRLLQVGTVLVLP
jgi:hypothetical protein